jgi:hypothetical protein
MSYSPQTLAFLASAGVTPLDLWHIPAHSVPSEDGWREAWTEVRSGLEPTNTTQLCWDEPRREAVPEEPPPKRRAVAGRGARHQWQGLHERATPRPERFTSDADRRRAAAEEAVAFLETWPLGLVAEARACHSEVQYLEWKRRFTESMASSTDVRPRVACFRSLQRFCAERAFSVWSLSWRQVEEYLYSPSPKGKTGASVASRRFWMLSWFHKHWGLPLDIEGRRAPQVARDGAIQEESQAVAVDPWIMLCVEQSFARLEADSAAATACLTAWLMWTSAMRLQQLHRSVFTGLSRRSLWAVCSMGKSSPGFRWAIPRHASGGADLGGVLFRAWKRHSDAAGRPLPSVVFELRSGARMDYGSAKAAIQQALTSVGVTNAAVASTYSMRRGSATLCGTWASEAEKCANGFWLAKRGTSMPDRYNGQRVQCALATKFATRELLRSAAASGRKLVWAQWHLAVASLDVESARRAAAQFLADDPMESEVPQAWTGVSPRPLQFEADELVGLQLDSDPSLEAKCESGSSSESEDAAEPAPRLEVAADCNGLLKGARSQRPEASRSGSGSAPRSEEATSVSSCAQPRLSVCDKPPGVQHRGNEPSRNLPASAGLADELQVAIAALANCAWVASSYRAEFRVHVCVAGSLLPVCKQKKGGEARALRRPAAQGTDWGELVCLPAPYAFCEACVQKLGLSSALARAAVHEISSEEA